MSYFFGGALGLFYCIVSYLSYWLAMHAAPKLFYVMFLGGMAIRMFATLLILTVVLISASVSAPAFVGSFVAVMMVGLFTELAVICLKEGGVQSSRASPQTHS